MAVEEKKYKEIELRSEEVQEVMNHVPSWILRWGITVLFSIVIILLMGSFLFKYPDIVKAEVTISTQNPPAYVLAKASGRVCEIHIHNGSEIPKGSLMAVIENTANTNDILFLKKQITDWKTQNYSITIGEQTFNGQRLHLGEVQPAYASFISVLNDYADFIKQDYLQEKIANYQGLLNNQEEYYQLAEKQYQLAQKEKMLVNRIYERDSILYACKAMIAAEYDESSRNYLQSLQGYEGMRMSLIQINMQIEQNKGSILDIRHQTLTEEQKHTVDLKNAIEQLQVGISSWEQQYLLTAPISGKVSFMSVWSQNQNVTAGESVFVIAPSQEMQPIGKALLPIQGSGKVKTGQQVNIRLNNYPDQEFGYVKGIVRGVSPVPTAEGYYVVDVGLPKGLKTNYGKDLPLTREMKGNAEIITEDMKLIERLLAPLRKIISSGTDSSL